MWIVTAAELREIERRAADEFGISAETLMERAGAAVFETLQEMAPPGSKIAVVCGKGNNGGDGFVVARLAHQAGYKVRCFCVHAADELGSLCKSQMESVRALGARIQYEADAWLGEFWDTVDWDVVVDAVLGTGLSGELPVVYKELFCEMGRFNRVTLAVDVPSGINADTGQESGTSVSAARTVTLGMLKPFLFQGKGMVQAGDWTFGEIGLPDELTRARTGSKYFDPESLTLAARASDSNKGDNGHVLIVAGSRQYRGAATLAALGALYSGAGLVTVAAIETVVEAVAAQVPEATFIVLPERGGAIDGIVAADSLRMSSSRFTSATFGPGTTTSPFVKSFLESLWTNWSIPSVIDADALNLVAQGLRLPKGLNILTPHPGEAGRLLGTDAKTVQEGRFGSARALAEKFGCPVVLKGAYSVSALPDAPLVVNPTGNPGMATGGMGDVLSGVIATLLSQVPGDPALAGVYGAYWHGLAGDLAAKEIGEIGFSATDLAQFLPRARSILTT